MPESGVKIRGAPGCSPVVGKQGTEALATGIPVAADLVSRSTENYRRNPDGRGRQLEKNVCWKEQAEKTPVRRRQEAAAA
jgi:hypothetical protein